MEQPVWFRRFADVPGVRYETPPGLDLARLRRRGAVPVVHRYAGLSPSLSWEIPGGSTSQAPASEHALVDFRSLGIAVIRRNIAEALELPGEASDYHFALQTTAAELYRRRREDPAVLDDVERLYLLDLQLIEACPLAVSWEQDGLTRYYFVEAFNHLLRMYLAEGRVGEALAVADLAGRLGLGGTHVVAARQRAAALAAEDAP